MRIQSHRRPWKRRQFHHVVPNVPWTTRTTKSTHWAVASISNRFDPCVSSTNSFATPSKSSAAGLGVPSLSNMNIGVSGATRTPSTPGISYYGRKPFGRIVTFQHHQVGRASNEISRARPWSGENGRYIDATNWCGCWIVVHLQQTKKSWPTKAFVSLATSINKQEARKQATQKITLAATRGRGHLKVFSIPMSLKAFLCPKRVVSLSLFVLRKEGDSNCGARWWLKSPSSTS